MTSNDFFDDKPPQCPRCSSERVVPVVYQSPSEEMLTAEKLGLIALGAAGETLDAPAWKCSVETCGCLF